MTSRSVYVLLVEDDENDVLLTQRAFRMAGVTAPMHVTRDGEEAIAHLAQVQATLPGSGGGPGVVLLDLKLPRRSGFDVLEWVRSQPGLRRIPVVVLSSSDDATDIGRCYDLGANSYLVKPVGQQAMADIARLVDEYWVKRNTVAELGAS
jgi:CheY-like chemotaxis protein